MAYSTSPHCMHLQALIISIGLLLGLPSMSMLVAGSSEEAPSSCIELINEDANAGVTREELISSAVDRAHLREAMLSPATDGTTSTKVEACPFGHDSYRVKLKMGTESFWLVADTGSDLVWRTHQISDVIESMPCDCVKDVSKPSECCSNKLRIFNKKYGTGKKAAKGFMCREKVTLSQLMPEPRAITLGFAIDYDDHLLPGSANGIVGLNRGKFSLLRQLKVTKFSYCLSNRTKTERKSFFWFGGDNMAAAGTWKSTTLVQMLGQTDMYHIALLGISIVDGGYKELGQDYFEHKSEQGDGVMFVDSGCSHTLLETRVFSELKSLLEGKLGKPSKDDKVHTCFPASKVNQAPTLDLLLHLKDNVQMRIPRDNYLLQLDGNSDFCLAIYDTAGESVMGNIMQHDIRMHFDLDNKKLSFKPVADCTNEP